MSPIAFMKLPLQNRLQILQTEGEFVGARIIPSYHVSLFTLHGFYVEMFVIQGLDQVHWIEVQTNKQILHEYIKDIDINDLFR